MSKWQPDADDRPVSTLALRNPWRLSTLIVDNNQVLIEQYHAFMWLALKYSETKYKRGVEDRGRLLTHLSRLLLSWLQNAEFEDGAIH